MKKKYGQISSKISGNKAGFREKYFPENSPFFKEILIYPKRLLARCPVAHPVDRERGAASRACLGVVQLPAPRRPPLVERRRERRLGVAAAVGPRLTSAEQIGEEAAGTSNCHVHLQVKLLVERRARRPRSPRIGARAIVPGRWPRKRQLTVAADGVALRAGNFPLLPAFPEGRVAVRQHEYLQHGG